MKLMWLALTLLFWICLSPQALAQESAPEDRDCIPASEIKQASGEQSGPSQEGAANEDESDLPVCEEMDSEREDGEAEPVPDSEARDAEQAPDDVEIDPEQEFEVDPEDEISEDYPVPLPSDI